MVKRMNSPVKQGIKSYFAVIPKPPPKPTRGRPRKQQHVVVEAINNDEAGKGNKEQQTAHRRKGSHYVD